MTFETNKKNTFKKDPLRGLEYSNQPVKPTPFVQIVLIMVTFLLMAVAFKACFQEPEVITIEQLNADRR